MCGCDGGEARGCDGEVGQGVCAGCGGGAGLGARHGEIPAASAGMTKRQARV